MGEDDVKTPVVLSFLVASIVFSVIDACFYRICDSKIRQFDEQ